MEKIWLSSYAPGVPKEMVFEKMTLSDALARTANRFPNHAALHFQGKTIKYRQLDEMVSGFAAGLQAMGVRPGDKVAILLPNIVQTVVAAYGAWRAGAVAVMNNPLYTDRELEHQFNDSGSTCLVALDVLMPRMIALRDKTKIRKIFSCHIRDYLPFPKKQLFAIKMKHMHLDTPKAPDVFEFADLIKTDKSRLTPTAPAWDDTAILMYTGGTTGVSKGVQLTHGNISSNCQQGVAWFPVFKDGEETVVGALPFFHSFGLTTVMNVAIFKGYAIVLVPNPRDPKNILEAISKYKATYIPAVPTIYNAMINYPDLGKYDLTSLRACFSGGAPLPLETIKAFERKTGTQICEGYGLTESSPITHINPFGGVTKPGTIGVPVPGTDVKIVDVDDYSKEITEPGKPGEVCLKGPQIMKGYINRPEETAETLRDGWLLTGDIGEFDEQGYFKIVDRKKDMIISGGFNIYPRDVDEVLFAHPKIKEACAIGVPDPHSGERIKAFIVLKEGEKASVEEIIAYCTENLAPYKIPKYIEFMDDLPKSPVGKILRKDLKSREAAKRKQ
jgi:long-chain acyl-CoA synthetase